MCRTTANYRKEILFYHVFIDSSSVVSELHSFDSSVNLETFFQKIQFEKFNQSSLGTNELLIKDYKNFHAASIHYGIIVFYNFYYL